MISKYAGHTAKEWYDMCEEATTLGERLDVLLLKSLANEKKVREERDAAEAEVRRLLDLKALIESHIENRTLTYRDCFTRICEALENYEEKK